jgi:LysM repeat protein
VSSRTPRRRPRRPGGHRSPWAYVAPAALLGAVTVIVLISSSAGWIGHPADGGAPPSTTAAGPVQTLQVPDTAPPALPATTEPAVTTTAARTVKAHTSTAATTAKTTTAPATAPATSAETTPASTASATTTASDQHVKWTVKQGDTLSSIATQFGTSVSELERLNPDIDPATLQVGQTLEVR